MIFIHWVSKRISSQTQLMLLPLLFTLHLEILYGLRNNVEEKIRQKPIPISLIVCFVLGIRLLFLFHSRSLFSFFCAHSKRKISISVRVCIWHYIKYWPNAIICNQCSACIKTAGMRVVIKSVVVFQSLILDSSALSFLKNCISYSKCNRSLNSIKPILSHVGHSHKVLTHIFIYLLFATFHYQFIATNFTLIDSKFIVCIMSASHSFVCAWTRIDWYLGNTCRRSE